MPSNNSSVSNRPIQTAEPPLRPERSPASEASEGAPHPSPHHTPRPAPALPAVCVQWRPKAWARAWLLPALEDALRLLKLEAATGPGPRPAPPAYRTRFSVIFPPCCFWTVTRVLSCRQCFLLAGGGVHQGYGYRHTQPSSVIQKPSRVSAPTRQQVTYPTPPAKPSLRPEGAGAWPLAPMAGQRPRGPEDPLQPPRAPLPIGRPRHRPGVRRPHPPGGPPPSAPLESPGTVPSPPPPSQRIPLA